MKTLLWWLFGIGLVMLVVYPPLAALLWIAAIIIALIDLATTSDAERQERAEARRQAQIAEWKRVAGED